MNEIDKTNLANQTKIRLNKITDIQNYLNQEINQRKLSSKKLSKYVAPFDYIDKVLIVLSATTGGICIVSRVTVAGLPVGIACAGFIIAFCLTTGTIKKIAKHNRKQKEKAWKNSYVG